jgi:hypothetical protein
MYTSTAKEAEAETVPSVGNSSRTGDGKERQFSSPPPIYVLKNLAWRQGGQTVTYAKLLDFLALRHKRFK